jgi:hypothetical protein
MSELTPSVKAVGDLPGESPAPFKTSIVNGFQVLELPANWPSVNVRRWR